MQDLKCTQGGMAGFGPPKTAANDNRGNGLGEGDGGAGRWQVAAGVILSEAKDLFASEPNSACGSDPTGFFVGPLGASSE